jgi:hypothetical protein
MMTMQLRWELFALDSGLTEYAPPDRAPLSAGQDDSSTDYKSKFILQVRKYLIFPDEHT